MCRIVEEIVKKEREEALNEAFLQFVQNMSKQHFSLAQMPALSGRSEEEVIAALKSLGLSVPQ